MKTLLLALLLSSTAYAQLGFDDPLADQQRQINNLEQDMLIQQYRNQTYRHIENERRLYEAEQRLREVREMRRDSYKWDDYEEEEGEWHKHQKQK